MWVLSLGWRSASALGVLASSCFLASCCPPVIFTDTLPIGRVDEPYHFTFETECWTAFWWMTGELPVGMSFDSDGVLQGTPRYAGIYFITVGWDDVVDGEVVTSVSKAFELVIVEATDALPERPEALSHADVMRPMLSSGLPSCAYSPDRVAGACSLGRFRPVDDA